MHILGPPAAVTGAVGPDSRLGDAAPVVAAPQPGPSSTRDRGVSAVSSPSISGSSDGVRSPEQSARKLGSTPWSQAAERALAVPSDERRGRPEKRFDDFGSSGAGDAKGKRRVSATMNDLDEVDELDEDARSIASTGTSRQRMHGVESGLNELRVSGALGTSAAAGSASLASGSPATTRMTESPGGSSVRRGGAGNSSRSRSRVRAETERGRSRGPLGGPSVRSTSSTSRVRGGPGSTASSSSQGGSVGRDLKAEAIARTELLQRDWPAEAIAEVQRLRNKISELTFLNGLMQSRLGQLEGPGRVPRHVMTSLTAETPRPDPDDMLYDEEEEQEDEEMQRPEPMENTAANF